MDKISDFFKDLKERISSPLFSSFIIAWLIFNWKLIIGLFFYKNDELKADGYNSYLDFISHNLDTSNTFWKPLGAALIYTIIFPFIRNCILAFNSWIKAWGNTWNLSISKTSKVSIAKYIQLREIYQNRTTLLEEVLAKESTHLRQYEEARNEALSLRNEKNEITEEIQKWKTSSDVTQLSGEWEIHYPDKGKPGIYRVRVTNTHIEFLDIPPAIKNKHTLIRSFFRNPNSTYLTFTTVFENTEGRRTYHFFHLDILDEMRLLRGVEDDHIQIEFHRTR